MFFVCFLLLVLHCVRMYAVVTLEKKTPNHKIVPVKWLINVDKKSWIKTNTYMTYFCFNLFENPNFDIGNYGKVSNFQSEGIYKVYILKFCGKYSNYKLFPSQLTFYKENTNVYSVDLYINPLPGRRKYTSHHSYKKSEF